MNAPITPSEARQLQQAYATRRRRWAKAVGRPYPKKSDPRPPPGEIEPPSDDDLGE
ncbi:MAG TPA: hypothetical protein VGS12_06750 [Caulobacteraceae bacterium]|nr:hypothetical protein [Caulobacteraceae bacterium]